MELVLRPRRDFVKWARLTKQTPNMKIGYPGQHLASLVTGMEGTRTGARGHDLSDRSEVKSCSRVDQLDKCKACRAAVARIEKACPECRATDIKRNNDSKWLLAIKSEEELSVLIDETPRILFILFDYPHYESADWETVQFQTFEIWPQYPRHSHFRMLMERYYRNIYVPNSERNSNRPPAPKNLWPYSFQFFMCNPVRTYHCIIRNATSDPEIDTLDYVEPTTDRAAVEPLPMPLGLLTRNEKHSLRQRIGGDAYDIAETNGLNADQRLSLELRDTDHASPQNGSYTRGAR